MIALDTNLLVYTNRENTSQHAAARAAVVRTLEDPRGWGICLPSIAEFWRIVTNPDHPGEKSTVTKAAAFIHNLVTEGHGHIWTPVPVSVNDCCAGLLSKRSVENAFSIFRSRRLHMSMAPTKSGYTTMGLSPCLD